MEPELISFKFKRHDFKFSAKHITAFLFLYSNNRNCLNARIYNLLVVKNAVILSPRVSLDVDTKT